MCTRNVRYYRIPNTPGMSHSTLLELDLLDVAHASISEAGLTGGPISPFLSMYNAQLTNDTMLKWKGRGPGQGRELRRSYSNIHGRMFARSYLEANEGVIGLLPIDGNHFSFGHRAVVRLRDDEKGDMPDWIGWNQTEYIVAEAKGSYAGGDWENNFWHGYATPQCLRKAQEQVARVQVDLYGYMIDVGFKGWSVASRWATEENGLDPWLVAIDPNHGGENPSPEWFRESVTEMQRLVLRRMIATFGFSDEESMMSPRGFGESIVGEFQPYREHWRKVVLSDEAGFRGLSAACVGNNFIPITSYEQVVILKRLCPEGSLPWLVTILDEPLAFAERGELFSEFDDVRSQGLLSRNGMAVADLRMVRALDAD